MATAPPKGKAIKGDCYVANGRLALDTARGLGPLGEYKDEVVLVHGVALNSRDFQVMGHCWVEIGSTVYDYSNGRQIKKSKLFYYNIRKKPRTTNYFTIFCNFFISELIRLISFLNLALLNCFLSLCI